MSDGSDYISLEQSIWSIRKYLGFEIPIVILTEHYWPPSISDVSLITPTDILRDVGFFPYGWARPISFSSLYKLTIPLLSEFQETDYILYLDSNTLCLSDQLKSFLFSEKNFKAEVTGTPSLETKFSKRIPFLLNNEMTQESRALMEDSWGSWGIQNRKYINDGVLIYNLNEFRKNGLENYKNKLMAFWNIELKGNFQYLAQDFINIFLDTDSSLPKEYNSSVHHGSTVLLHSSILQQSLALTLGWSSHSTACCHQKFHREDLFSKKQMIFFICHFISEESLWRYRKLKEDISSLNIDLLWCYNLKDSCPPNFPEDVTYDFYTDADILNKKELLTHCNGQNEIYWSNTNYVMMEFSQKYSSYDYYWIIEFDVCFSGNWETFFSRMNTLPHDLLCERLCSRYEEPTWWWWGTVQIDYPWNKTYKALNCITRMSKQFRDFVYDFYMASNGDYTTFFEHIWASLAMNNFSCFDLYPGECAKCFNFTKLQPVQLLNLEKNKLYHAVKEDTEWRRYSS